MKYFNVYYYCNIISNIIESRDPDYLIVLSEFSHPYMEERPEDFIKDSVLIKFCRWASRSIMEEDMEIEFAELANELSKIDINNKKQLYKAFYNSGSYHSFEVERAIKYYFDYAPKFLDWLQESSTPAEEAFEEYLFNLWIADKFEDVIDQIAKEMFFILFQNRNFLLNFNYYLSCTHKYKIKRTYMPKWVKRAVFFRDRGKCVFCNNDLSGEWDVVEQNSIHYDHIIPLNYGGLNDISNIQLSCKQCNLNKSNTIDTSASYKNWY